MEKVTNIHERFKRFDESHPYVWEKFKDYALKGYRSGMRRIGAQLIFEILRWENLVGSTGDDFKLNNDFVAHYARKFLEYHPQCEGIFELRVLRS